MIFGSASSTSFTLDCDVSGGGSGTSIILRALSMFRSKYFERSVPKIDTSKSGKSDPPFCTMTRFFDFQVPLSHTRISFLSVSLCLRKRAFSGSLNFTTPCKTFNTHSHMHLTSGLSAVRDSAIATLCLLSPWQRAFKRASFLFEKCLPHGAALQPIDAIVFSRLINTRFIQRDLKYLGTYATWAPSLGNIFARNLNSSK